MARKPSVFVRSISDDEGQRLLRITRRSKDPVRLRRAIVVLSSAQGRPVKDIAALLEVSENYMRMSSTTSTSTALERSTQNGAGVGHGSSTTPCESA